MTKLPVLACVLTVLAAAAACQDASRNIFATSAPRERLQAPPAINDAAKVVVVEFDGGAAVAARGRGGQFEVTAFQVGFFGRGEQLVRTIEIPRDKARITGTTVRIDVPIVPIDLTRDIRDTDVSIRVRVLTSGTLGAWSGPAGSVTIPVVERPQRQQRAPREQRSRAGGSAPPRARNQPLVAADLDQFPQLKAAIVAQLDGGLALGEAVAAFTRPEDIAIAVVIGRTRGISLARMCEAMRGRARDDFQAVLTQLEPSLDPRSAIRSAREEAQRLVSGRP